MTPSSSIRTLRRLVGLSQRDLAERIGVSRQTVKHWEAGKRSPSGISTERMLRIAKAHSLPYFTIFGDE